MKLLFKSGPNNRKKCTGFCLCVSTCVLISFFSRCWWAALFGFFQYYENTKTGIFWECKNWHRAKRLWEHKKYYESIMRTQKRVLWKCYKNSQKVLWEYHENTKTGILLRTQTLVQSREILRTQKRVLWELWELSKSNLTVLWEHKNWHRAKLSLGPAQAVA